jgi:hypothetical protein
MNDPEIAALGRRQALTAIVPVASAQVTGLEAKLLLLRNQWAAGLRGAFSLHFAKLALLPAFAADRAGLLIETTFDGELRNHLGELWDNAGGAYAELLRSCEGGGQLDRDGFCAFVERHAVRTGRCRAAWSRTMRSSIVWRKPFWIVRSGRRTFGLGPRSS